jgi:hypothetical protein
MVCFITSPHHIRDKINLRQKGKSHVRWFPCHHGLVHPQVVDGGDSLQIWRVAVNILNKQSQTADKGWSPAWGFDMGLKLLTIKNNLVMKIHKKPQTCMDSWINDLSERKWI